MNILDELFSGGAAFAQITGLFIALVFLLIGLVMVAGDLRNAATGRRVRARITSLRQGSGKEGAVYYSVYEYTDLNGQTVEAHSDWGSSSLTDKEIGTTTFISIDPARPDRARTTQKTTIVIGALLMIGAGIGLYNVLTLYPVTKYTWGFGAAGLAWLVYKFSKILKPKHLRETKDQFTARIDGELNQQRSQMPLLGRRDVAVAKDKQMTAARKLAPILLLVSLGLFYAAYYTGSDMLALQRSGVQVQGEFVRYREKTHIEKDSNRISYAPVVQYEDINQHRNLLEDKWSSNSRTYQPGDPVPVLYIPGSNKAIIDRGLINWAPSAACLFFAVICLLGATTSWRKSSRI